MTGSAGRRFSGWVSRQGLVGCLGVLGMAAGVLVAMTQSGGEAQLALIPTAIAVGVKFFGSDKGDPETALSDEPAVAFLLGAFTTGDAGDADKMIGPNAGAYMNGVQFINPEGGDSAAQFVKGVGHWHSQLPDLSINIYDEVAKKHVHRTENVHFERTRAVAVRFVLSGIPPDAVGESQVEGAVFVNVVHGKATEWRVVIDSQVVDDLVASRTQPSPGDHEGDATTTDET